MASVAGTLPSLPLSPVVAQEFSPLGTDLLPWLVLALGAAMVFGNVVALVRPPDRDRPGELKRAPLGRTVGMIAIGFVGAVWALASLIST